MRFWKVRVGEMIDNLLMACLVMVCIVLGFAIGEAVQAITVDYARLVAP